MSSGELEVEAVGVGRGGLAHFERDDARAVALRIVAPSRLEPPPPRIAFEQTHEALRLEARGDRCRRMEHARALLDKRDEVLGRLNVLFCNHVYSSTAYT